MICTRLPDPTRFDPGRDAAASPSSAGGQVLNGEVLLLLGAAVSVAFVHTVAGPDHYLPFVAMARAGSWSRARTIWITALCGLGHDGSSLLGTPIAATRP